MISSLSSVPLYPIRYSAGTFVQILDVLDIEVYVKRHCHDTWEYQ